MKSVTKKPHYILNIIFIIYSLICILPIVLIISISLSDQTRVLVDGYSLWPQQFTVQAYRFIFTGSSEIIHAYILTIGITIAGTILTVLVVSLFAYPLSRSDLKYKNFFSFYIFFTMLFSGGLVPWYIVCTQIMRLQNTYFALFLPMVFNAWFVIVLRTFFKTTIPDSVIESARIDGAGELRIYFFIVSPLSKAGYATIALFAVLNYWNDWWLSMILTTDKNYRSLQFLLYKILAQSDMLTQMANKTGMSTAKIAEKMPSETARFALCLVTMGPILFIYPFFQKYFIKGITIGAIKG